MKVGYNSNRKKREREEGINHLLWGEREGEQKHPNKTKKQQTKPNRNPPKPKPPTKQTKPKNHKTKPQTVKAPKTAVMHNTVLSKWK